MPSFDIITIGDMCVDLIVSGRDVTPQFGQVEKLVDDYTLEMGGSCAIFACQAARLGLRVAVLGKIGPDSFGQLILSRLQECGVDTRYVQIDPAWKTGLGIALCPTQNGTAVDRAILTYEGTICGVTPDMVTDEFLGSARHLHHGSFFLQRQLHAALPGIFRRAKALGLTISLDTNWDPDEQWDAGLNNLLPLTDVFFPNEQEAVLIAGKPALDQAIAHLHGMGVPLLAVKRGHQGALVDDDKTRLTQSVPPALPGGDSIGAGDSFDAGFLYGWLNGQSLARALEIGCACGRAVAGATGGLNGQLKNTNFA